jgi:hypothetical protein
MTPDTKRFANIVIEFDPDCNDVISAAFEMLSFALGKLPAAEREAMLSKIENGNLRSAVCSYVAAQFRPYFRSLRNPYAH